jgi:hypothetical protein
MFVRLAADTYDITAGVSPAAIKMGAIATMRITTVANMSTALVRHAQPDDLARIVAIYNASIPGRMATADSEAVTVALREAWFRDFDPARRTARRWKRASTSIPWPRNSMSGLFLCIFI